ncbi:LysR family transcriptional regulator [Bordetella genomosp. 1]|uniref:LysR family transcriptional regulator n=1 Tax=Bordetella genomosp. 1 TaxID=1395607 RepID=A0A261RVH6_9BORD|nr:LysR family transcriptional regulator [Bordetella genomosp. 1]MDQ8033619.1 LysR family transcriptional regulator [Bordetella sp.]OZI28945.1 LysR family transcriptional regulator [Bordetella genomosp. 1]OZI68044.1 LysR family transcriptional regulator [Bordetella genomosp. 1]
MRGLNLDHLRVLLDIFELGSFSAAAERNGLTQPAVSQQVRALERRYGLRLVERLGRRVSPTAAGAELVDHLRRIEAAVADADQAMQSLATGVSGRVRLGTGATACTYLLPQALAGLRGRYPDIEVVASVGNTADILREVEHNQLDLGLVTLPVAGRAFQVTPLMDDEFVVIFPEAAAAVARVTPQVLAAQSLVLFEPGARTRDIIDEWFEDAGVAVRPATELGSTEALKEFVRAGLGCGIVPRMAVARAGNRAGLRVQSLTPRLVRRLAIVMRRDKPLSRALRQVVEMLQALSADRPAALAGSRRR